MKKKYLLFLLILSANSIFSQKITYLDLKYLLDNDIDNADTYITNKEYEFYKTDVDADSIKSMFWAFKRDYPNDHATSFIAKNKFEAGVGFIWLQLDNKKIFNDLKTYCKANGFKLLNSDINKFGDLCNTYINSNYEIKFCSGINKPSNLNEYLVTLSKR